MKGRRDVDDSPPENCCLVIPVTVGTAILSALAILSSALSFTTALYLLKNPSSYFIPVVKAHTVHNVEVIAYSAIAFSALMFVFAALALQAVVARKPSLLLPFAVILVFSCAVSFFVLLDQLHRYATVNQYSHHRLVVSILIFLIKLYFVNCVYQCYQHLRFVATRRQSPGDAVECPRSAKTYIVLPKYEDLVDTQPPAYN